MYNYIENVFTSFTIRKQIDNVMQLAIEQNFQNPDNVFHSLL